ncbi:MAG: hypothetical protein LBN95_06080 [Prevotellaceae bacterium]|jgi:hypothetical protein|nr:hypothetical protein [Prevotellaceae bacterium]
MINEIILPHGAAKKIKKSLNTTYPTIKSALRGQSVSPLCQKIRQCALHNGGYEVKIINQH